MITIMPLTETDYDFKCPNCKGKHFKVMEALNGTLSNLVGDKIKQPFMDIQCINCGTGKRYLLVQEEYNPALSFVEA